MTDTTTGADGTGQEQQQQQQATPSWLDSMPDDLKGDATLGRFADPEALARGFIETQKLARSKFTIPAADAGPDVWNGVFEALGAPSDAAAYDIPLPEGMESSPIADAWRSAAHGERFLPQHAKFAAEFFNGQAKAAEDAHYAEGDKQLGALKQEWGAEYEPRLNAAKAVFAKMGLPEKFADELDRKVGSDALIRGFDVLAKAWGEQPRVDGLGGDLGDAGVANAEDQLKALNRSDEHRAKVNAKDPATLALVARLTEAAKAQGSR